MDSEKVDISISLSSELLDKVEQSRERIGLDSVEDMIQYALQQRFGKIKPPKPQKKAQNDDFISRIVTIFTQRYKENRGVDYILINQGKERNNAGKILKIYKEKKPDASSYETESDLSLFFSQCLKIQDDFYYDNMSLSLIVNKFNEIRQKITNGKQQRKELEAEQSRRNVEDAVNRIIG